MQNFKLTQRDKYLLTVFIICCVLVTWMAWRLNEPVEHARTDFTTGSVWTSGTVRTEQGKFMCLSNGKVFEARKDGVCYTEDMDK